MNGQSYLLEIYDADDFSGPNPLPLKGMGIMQGPERTKYFILETTGIASNNGTPISQIAVRAHYNGDPISRVTDGTATVSIALVKNSLLDDLERRLNFDDLQFWKVGKMQPANS